MSLVRVNLSLYDICVYSYAAHQRDKMIARDDEFSDSDGEGEGGRRVDLSYKRPRLMEEPKLTKVTLQRSAGGTSSPLPPEPSPITPLAPDEGASKGTCTWWESLSNRCV